MTSYQADLSRPAYRPEIDGLRAVAVMAVLIFHFYPKMLPYGYLGVDVFFVISGHIISLNIISDFSGNSFSFINFYVRRAKRILPAVFAVVSLSFLCGFFILMGPDFDSFAHSAIATITFWANIFFWRDGGYFGSNDGLKPLLHMWSLGVEEQFYLLFPLGLVLILRLAKTVRYRLALLSVLSVASFAMNYRMIHSSGANPAFFLVPFRAWQFGIGAVSALVYSHYRFAHNKIGLVLSFLLAIVGLILCSDFIVAGFVSSVAVAYFLSGKYVPVRIINSFFSNRIVLYIGLISFSLYLWHWPILVFVRYVTVEPLSNLQIPLIAVATFALASLSYRYVETPFRHRIRTSVVLWGLVCAFGSLLVLCVLSLVFADSKGGDHPADMMSRQIQTHYRCAMNDYIGYGGSRACLINQDLGASYRVALIGNSHAQMYVPSLRQTLRQHGEAGLLVPLNGCLPTIDVNIDAQCLRLSRANYDAFMSDANIKVVIFSLTWYDDELVDDQGKILTDADKSILSESLLRLVTQVRNTGRDVFLVGPIQSPGYDLPSVLSRKMTFWGYSDDDVSTALRIPRSEFDRRFGTVLAHLQDALGGNLLRPDAVLCDAAYCYFGDQGGSYFADGSHLGRYGVARMDGLFAPIFQENSRR